MTQLTPPRAILLPGLHGTRPLFEPLRACLPESLPVEAIDYPADQRLGFDELLPLVRDRLPGDLPFVLLGESFSGPLVIRLAAESPAGLRGVILVGTFVRNPIRWLPARIGPWVPSFLFRGLPLWMAFRMLALGRFTLELRKLFRAALAEVKPQVLAHRLAEVLRVDVTEEFQHIAVPILILAGRFDRTVPIHHLKTMQRLRTDLQVEMIDSDHLILQLEPRRCAEVIERFIAAVSD